MELIQPDWPAPENIKAFSSTRLGGHSCGIYAGLNLGLHVRDDAALVEQNRAELPCPQRRFWLSQVHGGMVLSGDDVLSIATPPEADGVVTNHRQSTALVMTADCLPLLLCDKHGKQVAAVHCGWRSLAANIIQNALSHFAEPDQILAWMGPAISSENYEVGDEVRKAFPANLQSAFLPGRKDTKWQLDLYHLARLQLKGHGVSQIFGGDYCTFADSNRFYSHRRDGLTGRMVSAIWRD